ncbi:hypothetical protein [Bradyrhizobium sp. Leo170]|nr:hypothetical protein [Bradyrhizobium sp. Leo170]
MDIEAAVLSKHVALSSRLLKAGRAVTAVPTSPHRGEVKHFQRGANST